MRWDTERALGAAIRARREAMKLSLTGVSRAAMMDIGHLSKVERGLARAPVPTYDRIAKALGWTPAEMWSAATNRRRAA